ncbi:MAG: hypothetical protein R3C68_19535 [Myxococcota bacterium]
MRIAEVQVTRSEMNSSPSLAEVAADRLKERVKDIQYRRTRNTDDIDGVDADSIRAVSWAEVAFRSKSPVFRVHKMMARMQQELNDLGFANVTLRYEGLSRVAR